MTPQIQHLAARADLLRQIREFFDTQGFLEVQPPCLCRDSVVDPYIDPLAMDSSSFSIASPLISTRYYLQTSPESAMKRMLCAGAPSIYSIGPVFRSGERGPRHNLEFTMLEWYEVGGDAESAMDLMGNLAMTCLGFPSYRCITYREAFLKAVDLDPLADPTNKIAAVAARYEPDLVETLNNDRDGLLDVLIEPVIDYWSHEASPLILKDYPISQAALAKPSQDDPRCAARFELFVQGIELANGYDELQDAEVLHQRAVENNRKRVATGREPLETKTTLFQAMKSGMPQCSGVALGVDRLLMLKVGAETIDEVIPLTIESA